MDKKNELLALLKAYKVVRDASWPDLHPKMSEHAARWATMGEQELQSELSGYVAQTNASGCNVRVFWKLGADYAFAGCNEDFARDAGMTRPEDLVGLTDFDERVPWQRQASKFRADDEEVVKGAKPKLNILERQESTSGVNFVLVGKVPVLDPTGAAVGLLGMYESIDKKRAAKLYAQQVTSSS